MITITCDGNEYNGEISRVICNYLTLRRWWTDKGQKLLLFYKDISMGTTRRLNEKMRD